MDKSRRQGRQGQGGNEELNGKVFRNLPGQKSAAHGAHDLLQGMPEESPSGPDFQEELHQVEESRHGQDEPRHSGGDFRDRAVPPQVPGQKDHQDR